MMSDATVNPGKGVRVIQTSLPTGFDKAVAATQWQFIVRRFTLSQLFSEGIKYTSLNEPVYDIYVVSDKAVHGHTMNLRHNYEFRHTTVRYAVRRLVPNTPIDSIKRSLSLTPVSSISSGELVLDNLCFYPVSTNEDMTQVTIATRDLTIDRGTSRDDIERAKQIVQCTTVLKNLQDQLDSIFHNHRAKKPESNQHDISTPVPSSSSSVIMTATLSLDPADATSQPSTNFAPLSSYIHDSRSTSVEEVGQLYLEQQVIQRKLDKLRAEQSVGTIETVRGITHTIPVGTWHMLGHFGWIYVVPPQ